MKTYYVYVLASFTRVLYVGVTNNLERRVWEHKSGLNAGFTSRYGVNELVHVEAFPDPRQAIAREKEIKGWRRSRKLDLIEGSNPEWRDLSAEWFS